MISMVRRRTGVLSPLIGITVGNCMSITLM
jgi:hypothetical protein